MKIKEAETGATATSIPFGSVFIRNGEYYMKCQPLPGMTGYMVVNLASGFSDVWGGAVPVIRVEGQFVVGKVEG
jgi:hypothetical protein